MKKSVKALISLLIILTMITALLVPSFAQKSDDLSVYVASDIHYKPSSSLVPVNEANNLPGDEMYSHANTKEMLTYEADAIIDELLKRFEQSDAKYLLIPGDISEDGFWDEHLAIAQKLREFKERTGKKIFVIPGNHDIRTSDSQGRLNLSDFLDVYADIGYDEALVKHDGSASYTAELDGNYRLLAIDACIYRQDGSVVSDDLYSWIKEQVADAKNDGKKIVCMVHHNMLKHFGIEGVVGNMLCLDNYQELATEFADWGIKYVFTGHEHANDISSAVSENGNKIYDIETDSLITYPNAYRVVNFSEQNVKISTEYIDKINTDLLPEGFTEKQIELMKSNFPAYSLNYFRAGFRSYAYMIPGLTETLAEKLKIEQGSTEYKVISDVVDVLFKAANLPLYDNGTAEIDSIEEVVAKQGFELEKSEYKNLLDVVGVVYSGHYAGNENMENSLEVKLMSYSLDGVFTYAFNSLPSTVLNSFLNAIGLPETGFNITNTFKSASQLKTYRLKAANAVIKAFIEPVAKGIINDVSAPDDLNATLEGYDNTLPLQGDTIAITTFKSVFKIIIEIMKAVLNSVKNFINM